MREFTGNSVSLGATKGSIAVFNQEEREPEKVLIEDIDKE